MAEPKVVRLRDLTTGVVVQTTEDVAANLSGYEPAEAEEKSTGRRSSSK
ncbi:MAG TPA: hypothetical protein VFH80_06045 [Solirubrobacteraceae bacterium]|nr:hypothetical protein [Solirubrobacteraceae bacterium]